MQIAHYKSSDGCLNLTEFLKQAGAEIYHKVVSASINATPAIGKTILFGLNKFQELPLIPTNLKGHTVNFLLIIPLKTIFFNPH